MNTTGCPDYFARDDFFTMDPAAGAVAPCTVPIPLYATIFTIYSIILTAVAVSRTRYIVKRAYAKRQLGSPERKGRFGWLQILTITQSWLSAINCIVLFIVSLTYGTGHNIVIFLFGIQFLLYGISSERWLTKLIRLGSRIIGTKDRSVALAKKTTKGNTTPSVNAGLTMTSTGTEEEEEHAAMKKLRQFDGILMFLLISTRVLTVAQVVFLSILCMVFPTERRWLLAGIGVQAYLVSASQGVLVYQYQRCKWAITETQKKVQNLQGNNPNREQQKAGVRGVLKKFTRHQVILSLLGTPGSLIHLLWGVQAVPFTFSALFVSFFFDVAVNGSMFLTFVLRSSKSTSKKRTDARHELAAQLLPAENPVQAENKKVGSSAGGSESSRGNKTKVAVLSALEGVKNQWPASGDTTTTMKDNVQSTPLQHAHSFSALKTADGSIYGYTSYHGPEEDGKNDDDADED